MFSEKDLLVRQEQMKDLLRAAQRERLARQVMGGRKGRDSLHGRALVWLGGRMVDLGSYLEQNYGPQASAARFSVAGQERSV